jgi:hypothetical protein
MPMDPQRRACRVVWKGVVLALLATPYDRAPQLVTVGAWATLSLSPHPRRGLDVFGGAGLAYLGVPYAPLMRASSASAAM